MLHTWKLKKGVVKLLPKLLAKIEPHEMPGRPNANVTALWANVIAEHDSKGYLCLFCDQRKWLPKDRVRIL